MDYLAAKTLIKADTRFNLLGNKIVLIAPKDSKITSVDIKGADLAKALNGGRLSMANVDSVPVGKYGKAALEKLGAWNDVKDHLAQAENVRAALLLVARGGLGGKSFLDTRVHLPLILPPVVTGYLLLISFGKRGPIGAFLDEQFGIVFSFRWTGAALACAVMGFPLLVRAIRLSIEAVDTRLESAAGTLGAHPLLVFATITLPLCLPGVIAGAILCFAKSMGDLRATITFVSNIPADTQN